MSTGRRGEEGSGGVFLRHATFANHDTEEGFVFVLIFYI